MLQRLRAPNAVIVYPLDSVGSSHELPAIVPGDKRRVREEVDWKDVVIGIVGILNKSLRNILLRFYGIPICAVFQIRRNDVGT